MDEFHRLVLEEFEGRVGRREWTYVLANGLWMSHRDDVTWLTRHNRASLTGAVRRACKKLAADGYLSAVPPTFKGDRWEFRLTQAGADELDENNTHCLLCEKLIKPGDPCHRAGGESSGEVACEACAPTWEEIREPGFWCDGETGEPVPPEEIEAEIAAHLASGGKITDKIVEPY